MSWSDEDLPFSHLFIAVPELLVEEKIWKYLRRKSLLAASGEAFLRDLASDKAKFDKIRNKYKNRPVIQRLLSVAPEVLTPSLVNLIVDVGLIKKNDGELLKVITGRLGVVRARPDTGTVLQRARRLMSAGYAEDAIVLLRSIDAISAAQAGQLRAGVLGGRVGLETAVSVRRAKSILEIMQLMGSGLIDQRTIKALSQSGVISNRMAESLLSALDYGRAQWTVWEGAKRADGLAGRMAYVVSGSFSFEALEVLRHFDKITPQQRVILEIAVQMSQRYNRVLMEKYTDRRYRVIPGQSPIAAYARQSQELDADLLRLLAKAADEARRASMAVAGAARGAEYALRARALHQAMRQVWEGTGYITIFHETQVADAAVAASEQMMKKYYKHMTPFAQQMMQFQARSGLDSYISRRENTLELSRRVYGNLNIWTKKVDQQISLGLLQGESAVEIGKRVEKFINPRVMGGVKYAAYRLGRTEIANAFHYTTIRHSREQPWVRGYKWNRSSSHKHSDQCDQYANDDHDGIGAGIFKKANVPGKPHPQCLCYLTIVGMTEDEFVNAFRAGRFKSYMDSRQPDNAPQTVREILLQRVANARS